MFRRIKSIGITHLHADHHLGFIGVLQERRRYVDASPIHLLAPTQLSVFLDFYDNCIEPVAKDYNLISNNELVHAPLNGSRATELGLLSIQTCLVDHCMHAYAFAVTTDPVAVGQSEAVKITYSGDTRPCQSLVELGRNTTVLIHEATFKNGLDLPNSMHCSTAEALEQAQRMGAQHTLLTHTNQQSSILTDIPGNLKNVGLALDNMEVVLSDFPKLDAMRGPFKTLFKNYLNDIQREQGLHTYRKNLR